MVISKTTDMAGIEKSIIVAHKGFFFVRYRKRDNDVYMFGAPVLRSEEERDFLLRIEESKASRKQFEENQENFHGKLKP